MKNTQLLAPVELRARGFSALVDALGYANAVRFMQQFEISRMDYTKERDSILSGISIDEIVDGIAGISLPKKAKHHSGKSSTMAKAKRDYTAKRPLRKR